MPEPRSTAVPRQATIGFSVWKASPIAMGTAHAHEDVEINFVTVGRCQYLLGGRIRWLREGDIVLFWAGFPHQTLRKSEDLGGLWATLPLPWLLRWPGTSRLAGKLLQGKVVHVRAGAWDRELFTRWVGDLKSRRAETARLAALEMEAWLSRVSLGQADLPRARREADGTPDAITRVTDYIAAHYQDDLRVEDIGRALRLHPKYLLGLFRRHCGMTLWDYLLRHRLAHAQRLLLTSDRTITDIALEAGFGSLSSFYQAFRKFLPGLSPKHFRNARGVTEGELRKVSPR